MARHSISAVHDRLAGFQTVTFTGGPTNNVGGAGSGPSGEFLGTIELDQPAILTITHSATGFTGAAGSGMGISSVPIADDAATVSGSDIFSTSPDRIFAATPSKVYTTPVIPSGTYYVGIFSGGVSSIVTATVQIEGQYQ